MKDEKQRCQWCVQYRNGKEYSQHFCNVFMNSFAEQVKAGKQSCGFYATNIKSILDIMKMLAK